jgi:protein-S-isoprenylcysteine O-methyltransferase Ste14
LWNDDGVEQDRPGVIAPPPLIFFLTFMAGYFCRDFFPRIGSPAIGVGVAVLGFVIGGWAFASMLRARTHIDPYKPTTALVTGGPYRFSRNPIYFGVILLYIGAALSTGLLSALILLPVAVILMEFGVIRREERYLERKFAEQYRVYRSHVRRWI